MKRLTRSKGLGTLFAELQIIRKGNRDNLELVGWLFWATRPFETVFLSISGRLPEIRRKKTEMIDKRKNVQTTPTRTYCKCSRPLPYLNPN